LSRGEKRLTGVISRCGAGKSKVTTHLIDRLHGSTDSFVRNCSTG
jgi:hypothetical protein